MVGALALAGIAVGAQSGPSVTTPAPTASKAQTFIGCLKPGAAADRYALINGKEKGAKKTDPKVTFTVVAESPKINLESHVGQEVEISGSVDAPAAKDGKAAALKATSIKYRADYCG
jgi:hypothetical protein